MTLFKHNSRLAVIFLALLFVIITALVGWVVTAEEFHDGGQRTLIQRWEAAVNSRITRAGDIFRRATGKSKNKRKSGNESKTKEVVGPASVLVLDMRNQPIKDVTITFLSAGTRKTVREKTNSRGRVDTKLPVGQYQLSFTHGKYSTEIRTDQRIAGPENGFFVNVVLETRVVVKGQVVNEEGKPVPGAYVTGQRKWLQQFSETGTTFLDDAAYPTIAAGKDGKFSLRDVSIGTNTFTAAFSGYATAEKTVEVPAGGLSTELKMVLRRPARIAGRVLDEQMRPLPKVKVTAISFRPFGEAQAPLPATGFVATTDAAGNFRLTKLFGNGYYHLRFEHASYAVMEIAQVAAGTEGLTMGMQRGGVVSGRVAYLDRPTTEARVLVQAEAVIEGTTITRSVMSQGSGEFAFSRLPYGSYQLSVDYNNFVNDPRPRVTSSRDKPSIDNLVEIYEASVLTGRVEDAATGDALGGAKITVKSTYGFARNRVRQFVTRADASGTYLFDKLPGGSHQVTAESEGYLPASGSVEDYTVAVPPGGRVDNYTVFLSKGGIVKGRVVDQDGNGIGEAEVQLYVASSSFSALNVKDLNQTTDGSGYFEFRDFPIGQSLSLYISGRKEGFAKKNSDLVELSPGQPEGYTNVVLTPGGVVTGRVTNTEGVPLYGVKVTFDSREFPRDPSPTEFYTFTDTQGNYLLEHCTPGRGRLVAEHDDYVRNLKSCTIPEGQLLSRQNFKMELARNISGTIADFRGNPIADARVTAAPLPKTKGSARTTTDKNGDFELEGLGEGSFRLETTFNLDTPDGKQTYTFIVPEVASGSTGVPIDCDIAPTALGRVLGDESKGVDDFTITMRSRLDTDPKQQFRFNLTRKYTKADGAFRLLNIPRGLYKLKVESPGYETWETEELVVGPGNRTRLPVIRLKVASQIIGTVVSATTAKPVQQALVRVLDADKKAVVTVNRIELAGYARTDILEYLNSAYDDDVKYDPDPMTRMVARVRNNVVTTLRTNFYGRFSVRDLADGMYTFEIEHPAFRPKRIRNVYVGREKQTDLGRIELDAGGTIRGRVIDLEGNGITNTSVEIKGELQGRNRARTDASGNFVLRGIATGEWPVSVLATLGKRKIYAWKIVSVRPDETSPVEFVLETTADVRGRVQLPGGIPNSGTVRLYVIDEAGAVMDDFTYSDNLNNGNYNITRIPPGRYFALVNGKGPQGNFAFWQWIDAARGRNNIRLDMISASMQGQTSSVLGGEPVAKAQVQLVVDVPGVIVPGRIQNMLRLSDSTNAAGKFNFPYLQAGTYRIWAGAPGAQIIPVDAVPISAGQRVKDYRIAVQPTL